MSEPARELSVDDLSQWPGTLRTALDAVAHGDVISLVTRDHQRVAALVPGELLEELEETVAVLSDCDAIQALVEARAAYAEQDVVRGVDAVRALLDERE